MAIDHPRHDELAGRINHVDIAPTRGYGRRPANRCNPIICDADDAIRHDLTVDRIEDGTADNVYERHPYPLAVYLALRYCFPIASGYATFLGDHAVQASN